MITRTTNNIIVNPTTIQTVTMKEVVTFLKATNTKREETDILHTRITNPTILNQQNSENRGTKVKERIDHSQLKISLPAHIQTAQAHVQTTPSQRRVGGRLHHFWRVWEELGVKGEVINILRDGLKWTFTFDTM